jgi:uncharacterized membrane protein
MFFESFGLLGMLGLVALVVIVIRLNNRLGLVERELGALRSFVLSMPPATATSAAAAATEHEATPAAAVERAGEPVAAAPEAPDAHEEAAGEPAGPWTPGEGRDAARTEPAPANTAARPPVARPDIETALGTRWAVWVGGIALALGGVFLIRYSIEAGIFGPGLRLRWRRCSALRLSGQANSSAAPASGYR